MSGFSAEFEGLRELNTDLSNAGEKVARQVPGVVSKGALNIKTQLREEAGRSRSFRPIVPSITYDLVDEGTEVSAEIGPVKGKGKGHAGNLGNIAYFGTSRGGGTLPDPQGALDAEIPGFEKALADLIEDAL
ncbi:MAG: hypothetical protein M0R06_02135 [Sphaerochaeta sp.]|nr:hypothetical protein [Sphaerochaeta sp.]